MEGLYLNQNVMEELYLNQNVMEGLYFPTNFPQNFVQGEHRNHGIQT
jgi:hypothetical protein